MVAGAEASRAGHRGLLQLSASAGQPLRISSIAVSAAAARASTSPPLAIWTKRSCRMRAPSTSTHAGEAGVRRVEPFHLSPRYTGREAEWLAEIETAFGRPLAP